MTINELAKNFARERIKACEQEEVEPCASWFYESIYKRGAKDAIKEIDIFITNHIHSSLCTSPIILDHVIAKIKEMLEEE